MAGDNKIYLPAQSTRRGKAGYKGKNVVIIGSKADKRDKATKVTTVEDET